MDIKELAARLLKLGGGGKMFTRNVNDFIFHLGEYFRNNGDVDSLRCLSLRHEAYAFPLGIDFPKEYFLDGESPEHIENVLNTQPIALYGAGMFGKELAKVLLADNVSICAFIDRKFQGEILGIPVFSYDEFRLKYPDVFIVIASGAWYKEIYDFLKRSGDSFLISTSAYIPWKYRFCYEEDMTFRILTSYVKPVAFNLCMSSGVQYFPDEIKLTDNEVFVDCGVFDGGDCELFYSRTGKKGRVFGFEPCYDNFMMSKKVYDKYSGAKLYNAGVADKNEKQRFVTTGMAEDIMARFSEDGNEVAETVRMDDALSGERVTYIKMDIEGYELAALKGAENLLRMYKPKLAISIYHKPEDFWEIPAYILSLDLGYKLFMKQYRIFAADTVLYCV